jgi:hypothetical protein
VDGPQLLGRVIVVAGDEPTLTDFATATVAAGALVAVVSQVLDPATPATVRFRADARDGGAWDRLAMHIEQHLGPVDGVVTDAASRDAIDAVFAADLNRRGHGHVVTVAAGDDIHAIVTGLCGTPPAATSPPDGAPRDR